MPSVQREAFKLLQLVRRLQKCMGGSVVLKWVRLQLRPAETPHMILKVRLMEVDMDSRAWNSTTNAGKGNSKCCPLSSDMLLPLHWWIGVHMIHPIHPGGSV